MADRDEARAEVLEAVALDETELEPTPEQDREISEGCMANALSGLRQDQKAGVRSSVSAIEGDLSLAIDRITKRRSRMTLQMDRLREAKAAIEGGASRVASLYAYAGPAIDACQDAASAARVAKEGSDIVHSRMNEIEYQMALISEADLVLASKQRELSGAMSGLDEMVLSLR